METVDIRGGGTQLSRHIKRVEQGETIIIEQGETIIITRDGNPVARLTPLDPKETDRVALARRRLGFLKGQMTIPDDFNEMGREDIERLFNGDE